MFLEVVVMKLKALSAVIICCLAFSLFGCSNLSYNAKLYNAENRINNDFAINNLIRNVYYSQSDSDEKFFSDDETYPESRTFIIENLEEYNKIFNNNIEDLNVDFNKQMLIVYTFRATDHRNLKLISVNLQDKLLKITFETIFESGTGDTSTPYQRWIVIKLDKVEMESIEFKQK